MSRDLFAYWDALRAGRAAPERSAIDPAAIRHVLAYTFLLEIEGGRDARPCEATFRLSGTRLNALFQRDLKGEPFARTWATNGEAEADLLLEGVLDNAMPTVAGVRGAPVGYEPADFELLLLPLRHHGRTHTRLLGSLTAAVVPSWIGLRPIVGLELSSFRTVASGRREVRGTGIGAPCPAFVADDVSPDPVMAPAPPRLFEVPVQAGPFRVYQGGRQVGAPLASPALHPDHR